MKVSYHRLMAVGVYSCRSLVRRRPISAPNMKYLSSTTKKVTDVVTRPPALVRMGIIGSSITLATPIFTIAGLFRVWSSVLPKSAEGLLLKRILSVLIGGGSITLTWFYFIPFLRGYPDLILPFAVSNGVMAMFWHGIAEAAVGLETLAGTASEVATSLPSHVSKAVPKIWQRLPAGGALIGSLTALSAPLLWDVTTDIFWQPELKELLLGRTGVTWLLDLYYGAGLAVALPVGVLSGISLHYIIKPFVLGFSTPPRILPWYQTSLPFLAVVSAACALYYGGSHLKGMQVKIDDFLWMPRLDPTTGDPISVNVRTGEVKPEHSAATVAASKVDLIQCLHYVRDPFSDLLLILRAFWFDKELKGSIPVSPSESLLSNSTVLNPAVITASNFKDYSDLYFLIDLLVRYAHLHVSPQSHTSELAELDAKLTDCFGIDSMKKMFRIVEVGCIARRRNAQKDRSLQTDKERLQLRTLISELEEHFSGENIVTTRDEATSERGKKVLKLLAANIPTLEKELADKLNYRIADNESKVINSYKREQAWEHYTSVKFMIQSASVAVVVALGGSFLKSVLGKN